jgi:hypothetical protein
MTKDDLVGVWRAAGAERANARRAQIMYSSDGFMAVLSTPAQRRTVAEQQSRMDLDAASAGERADAALGCVAYAGRFEVKGDMVKHHIEIALNPNLVGHSRVRRIELNGDSLTLCTLPDAQGKVERIQWQRVK